MFGLRIFTKHSCCHVQEMLVCSCLLSNTPTTCCEVVPEKNSRIWNYLISTAHPWNVNLEAPDKFGSTWLAKCQETHEGARRSNRPGRVQSGPVPAAGISDLGFGLEFVKKLLQCSGIMSIALEVAATLPPYLSTLQKTHQLQTLHRWIHLRYVFFVRQIRGDLRIKRCGFTLGNQNKYFQTLQIAFHINLYGYCVFHMTCQGFSTFDALPSKLLAGYNITKLSKHTCLVERSLGVKLPTIWIDGKTQVGSVREEKGRRKIREEKESEEGRCRCVREKVEKVGTLWFSDVSWLPRVEKEGY